MRATRLSLMVLLAVLAFVLWNAAWVTDRCGEWTAALDEADFESGFTREGFKAWVDGLFEYGDHHFDPRNRKDVMLKRGLMGSAVEIDVDSAGRVALGKLDVKPGTREKLGLVADVTVVGADDHFEVWNTEEWNKQQADFEMDLESLLYHD